MDFDCEFVTFGSLLHHYFRHFSFREQLFALIISAVKIKIYLFKGSL